MRINKMYSSFFGSSIFTSYIKCAMQLTACARSLDLLYIAIYYMKWVKTSWIYSSKLSTIYRFTTLNSRYLCYWVTMTCMHIYWYRGGGWINQTRLPPIFPTYTTLIFFSYLDYSLQKRPNIKMGGGFDFTPSPWNFP